MRHLKVCYAWEKRFDHVYSTKNIYKFPKHLDVPKDDLTYSERDGCKCHERLKPVKAVPVPVPLPEVAV